MRAIFDHEAAWGLAILVTIIGVYTALVLNQSRPAVAGAPQESARIRSASSVPVSESDARPSQ